ncbi:MAG: nucleotidyl transferase AbiEii/AbiGii toxin family protein [Bacteroidales bacterium]|nr:nucleotidyl transferase AbiEii/AbiGii toxin family protein [Bacteroidales bacterium]
MSTIFDQLLEQYKHLPAEKQWSAKYEVTQMIALAGLNHGGFFSKAAFYGGTCLRLFHNLRRYSEDMDFTLLQEDPKFHLENYFQPVIDTFKLTGRDVTITKKDKLTLGKVELAFLKDETDVYNLTFQTEKSLKVKIEIDIKPPLEFQTEYKRMNHPGTFMVRCMTLPCLYAGKMHALAFRTWKTRVKGRDWYDFEWYVNNETPLDYNHLRTRIKEFNGLDLSQEDFLGLLKERLATTDMELVKADASRFIENPHELDLWSNDYFLQLADRIKFV